MSNFYNNAFNTAKGLLTKFGQPVTLTGASSGGDYDPATGEATTPTTETVTGVGAVFNYRAQDIDGAVIMSGDAQLTLSTTGIPKVGMMTALNGLTWRVESVEPLSPAGEVVYYVLRLRK